MNYSVLTTENGYGLFVKSMNKLHKVTHLAFNEDGHSFLFRNQNLVRVAVFPDNLSDVQAMASQYGGDNTLKLQDKSSEDLTYTNFYIKSFDGHFYQVAGIFKDVDMANKFMESRDDAALIDSTNLKGSLTNQFHFIASYEKSSAV